MPSAIIQVAAAWVGGKVAGWAGGTIIAKIIGVITVIGVSHAGHKIFGLYPELKLTSPLESQPQYLTASPTAPIPVIYGTRRVGGLLINVDTSEMDIPGGTLAEGYLHMIIAICEGDIEEFSAIEIDAGADWEPHGSSHWDMDSPYDELVRVNTHLGADDQTADTDAWVELPGWKLEHRLRGVAYAYVRLGFHKEKFPHGIPEIRFTIKGRKVYDPRDTNTKWSSNPALCTRDYLTNTRYGRGIPEAQVPDAFIIAAANYCDEDVYVPAEGGGTVAQKRYTCNGIIDTGRPVLENLNNLLSSCRGMLIFSGGEYKLLIDKDTASTFAFTEDNIVGPIDIEMGSKSSQFNRMRLRFFNPEKEWQPDYAVPDSSTLRDDNDNSLLLEKQLDLPFTTNYYTAMHIGNINVNQSRQQIACRFRTFIEGMLCEVGDVVDITHTTPGWDEKEFRIVHMLLLGDGEVQITAIEYDVTVYTYGEINIVDATPNTNLPNPYEVEPPGAPDGDEELYWTNAADGIKIKVIITWPPSTHAYKEEYEIEYWLNEVGSSPVVIGRAENEKIIWWDVAPGNYKIRVKTISTLGIQSEWATTYSYTVVGETAAPSDIADLTIGVAGEVLVIDWAEITEADVIYGGYIMIRHSADTTSPDWDDDWSGTEWKLTPKNDFVLLPWLEGAYMVRARDATGNLSPTTTYVTTDGLSNPHGYDSSGMIQEDNTFPGNKQYTEVSGVILRVTAGHAAGAYWFQNWDTADIDLGSVKECRLTLDMIALLVTMFSTIDDRTEDMDDWPDFDGNVGATGFARVTVYTTDDDPSGSPTWVSSGTLTHGVYHARAFRFMLTMGRCNEDYNMDCSRLRVDYEYNAGGGGRGDHYTLEMEVFA